jgi:hypothetical protein
MLSLIQFNLPVLAAALLIGIATARWMFRHPARSGRNDKSLP